MTVAGYQPGTESRKATFTLSLLLTSQVINPGYMRSVPFIGSAAAVEDDTTRMPFPSGGGRILGMTVRGIANPSASTHTIYLNGIATAVSAVLPAGGGRAQVWAVVVVPPAADPYISIRVSYAGSIAGTTYLLASVYCEADGVA